MSSRTRVEGDVVINAVVGAATMYVAGVCVAEPVSFVEQRRAVRALESSVSSTDPGVFDETVQDSFNDVNTGDFSTARFSQRSEIHGRAITMSGDFDVFASTDISGSGSSVLEATFDLDEPSLFTLKMDTFDLVLGESAGMFADIELRDATGAAVASGAWTGLNPDGQILVDTSGVLPAGRYTLDVLVLVSSFKGTTNQGAYAMTFIVPSPGCCGLLVLGVLAAGRPRREPLRASGA